MSASATSPDAVIVVPVVPQHASLPYWGAVTITIITAVAVIAVLSLATGLLVDLWREHRRR